MKTFDVAVIGGGASGLTASIFSARKGKSVAVLERLPRVGKKILSTGNGRCNITNRDLVISHYHGENPDFAKYALAKFGLKETIDFFESIGLFLTEGENGRMYPMSLQASSVLDMLRLETERLKIPEITEFFVTKIKKDNNTFIIKSEAGQEIGAEKVIVAPGGRAAPSMGTDGNFYELLSAFGHKVIKTFPSLVQIKTENPMRALKGVKHNGKASLYVKDKLIAEAAGEILFTDYGISGPPIFNLSRYASYYGKEVTIYLNLLPHMEQGDIISMLIERAKNLPHLKGENFLNGILHKRLSFEIMKRSTDLNDIANLIYAFPFKVAGVMNFANAQVTAGGIDTSCVSPHTMESALCKGLYIIGEILDVDGDCGGYNLQWAWSSAFAASQDI